MLPEGKLFDSIYSYIDRFYEELDIDWRYEDNDDESWDENIIVFYDVQYGENYIQYIKKEYYENLDIDNPINRDVISKFGEKAPILELVEKSLPKKLNKIFSSNIWEPVFVKWFEDKYELPVKTLLI